MFINELAEPTLLVIYPGRFQPFHKGHYAVYEYLTGKFGRNNVFIATSNKVDGDRSPFTFSEKSYFMQLTGVPADRIVQSSQPYQIQAILSTGQITVADPSNTVVIFAVSEKDMSEDPRFSFASKKDGSPSYFQPLKNIKDTVSMEQHGYVMTVPTFDFQVLGEPMRSGTELRKMYSNADEKTRQGIVADLFGKYTREAEQILTGKLAPTAPAVPARPTKLPKTVKPAGGQVVEPVSETREPYQQSIDRLESARIEQLNSLMDEITHRITTEKLPAHYVDALKDRLLKLKAERNSYYGVK
ncbi:hypothetical protein UFOVP112_454 [uncultured Caudovirales phage]|uniref:Cytidyltransferase-like domain-containing protein n=1 Tax=uncultured Caudovirales phage TaxID=2100421 RepID=A0A6J5L807_9CAUD|nr:hypothetical protein UFOVP112_454 [uncultured Caudovirales phage]